MLHTQRTHTLGGDKVELNLSTRWRQTPASPPVPLLQSSRDFEATDFAEKPHVTPAPRS